jgi:hypothetical protein
MPQTIGNHGLYCPDFDDYAAVALYMQDLGTRIDSALDAQLDELNDFLNQPTIILTNSVAKTILTTDAIAENVFDTVVFNNSTFMSYDFTVNQILIGSVLGAGTTVPYRRGAYSAGACVRMTATGAVDVGSERKLTVLVRDEALLVPAIAGPMDVSSDQNTGGDEGVLAETNFVLSGTSGANIRHFVVSTNTSSDTTILAGGFLWCTYNGATDLIEVA